MITQKDVETAEDIYDCACYELNEAERRVALTIDGLRDKRDNDYRAFIELRNEFIRQKETIPAKNEFAAVIEVGNYDRHYELSGIPIANNSKLTIKTDYGEEIKALAIVRKQSHRGIGGGMDEFSSSDSLSFSVVIGGEPYVLDYTPGLQAKWR